MFAELVSLFLPKNLLNYFELTRVTEQEVPNQKSEILLIELDEKKHSARRLFRPNALKI